MEQEFEAQMRRSFNALVNTFKEENGLPEDGLQTLLNDIVAEREKNYLLKNKLTAKMMWSETKMVVYMDCVRNISKWIDYNAGLVDAFKGSEHLATVFAITKEEALNDIVAYREKVI